MIVTPFRLLVPLGTSSFVNKYLPKTQQYHLFRETFENVNLIASELKRVCELDTKPETKLKCYRLTITMNWFDDRLIVMS